MFKAALMRTFMGTYTEGTGEPLASTQTPFFMYTAPGGAPGWPFSFPETGLAMTTTPGA